MKPQEKPIIIIEVRGGVVQEVHSSISNVEIVLIDYDNEPADYSAFLHNAGVSSAIIKSPSTPLI